MGWVGKLKSTVATKKPIVSTKNKNMKRKRATKKHAEIIGKKAVPKNKMMMMKKVNSGSKSNTKRRKLDESSSIMIENNEEDQTGELLVKKEETVEKRFLGKQEIVSEDFFKATEVFPSLNNPSKQEYENE